MSTRVPPPESDGRRNRKQYDVFVARLVSVNTNADKEFRKLPRSEAHLIEDFGLQGDRHAGRPRRQVSILDAETVAELAERGMPVEPGVLGENVTVAGVPLMALAEGARLRIGDAELEITGDRPTCREMLEVHPDALKALVGRAGKMARVVRGGVVRPGDSIEVFAVAHASALELPDRAAVA
jgi:MOSC domain-containing protein YiiM